MSAVMFHATVSEQTPDTPVSFLVVLYPKNWSYKNYYTCAIGHEVPSPLRQRNLKTQGFFPRLGLPSTLIRHENGAIRLNALQSS